MRHFADCGRFAYSVHADEQDHRQSAIRRLEIRLLAALKQRNQHFRQNRLELARIFDFAFANLAAEVVDQLQYRIHSYIGTD
ncbi:Uncharacterised protein [Mycobacterium tuberculosis]|nr:Uncharacterised protein [Mycobacterium tuberculosis]